MIYNTTKILRMRRDASVLASCTWIGSNPWNLTFELRALISGLWLTTPGPMWKITGELHVVFKIKKSIFGNIFYFNFIIFFSIGSILTLSAVHWIAKANKERSNLLDDDSSTSHSLFIYHFRYLFNEIYSIQPFEKNNTTGRTLTWLLVSREKFGKR